MIFINTAQNTTGLFKPFFPITIPYGIGYLMAVLRKNGIRFSFVDQQVCKKPLARLRKIVDNHPKPYIFAISTLTESFSSARKLSDRLKKLYPDSIIIMGGIHPSSMPSEILFSVKSCDYVFVGEAESEIVAIYNIIKSGRNLSSVPGIGYRKGNEVIVNPPGIPIKDIDALPDFPYDLFDSWKQYNRGHIISSRGCPYNCSFCCVKTVGQRRYRYKNSKTVVAELELLAERYGQREIAFFDDNFLANKKRVEELCHEINSSAKLRGVTYSFQARTRDMNKEILELMFSSGFKAVFFGIETVSDTLLKQIGKDESVFEIEAAVKLAQGIGYKVMANFLFCLPGETVQVRDECVDFAIHNNIDLAKFNNVVPYPGTAMYDQLLTENQLKILPDYKNFNSQEVLVRPFWKKANFPFIPEGANGYGIKNEILFAYFRYYFRWRIIKRIVSDKGWGDAIISFGKSFGAFIKILPALVVLLTDISIKFGFMFLSVFSVHGIKTRKLFKSLSAFNKK
ncbi:MAG TPA: radical SAM protein [Bacteroidales bacterium]|nr:radical SAM protein [Bacteroidales bacterium]